MTRTLDPNSHGDDVEFLQRALNDHPTLAASLTVNGHFDASTVDAVHKFQASAGLTSDGVVNSATWTALLGRPIVETPGFFVLGRETYDRFGTKVVLRGVNKMSVFDNEDPDGHVSFPEIRKTGANTVRIVWAITKDLNPKGPATSVSDLETLITTAVDNRLIPMVELHDATGDWSRLGDLIDYWTQPAVVEVIGRHNTHLIVNIGNEVGDDQVTEEQFMAGYLDAVKRLRSAGLHTLLVIDSAEFGKNLALLNKTANDLLAADPDGNLAFSVHTYWSIACGFDANRISDDLQAAVDRGYALMIGEFAGFGGFPCNAPEGTSPCSEEGRIDYETILETCHHHKIGWYAWEWGPGNEFFDPLCSNMNMTTDRAFSGLQTGWANDVATKSPFGIAATSVTPAWI